MEKTIKDNTGRIWVNKYKSSEKHPDWKGKCNWKGEPFEISLWFNDGEGESYFSVALQEPYVKPNDTSAAIGGAGSTEIQSGSKEKIENDDLPF